MTATSITEFKKGDCVTILSGIDPLIGLCGYVSSVNHGNTFPISVEFKDGSISKFQNHELLKVEER